MLFVNRPKFVRKMLEAGMQGVLMGMRMREEIQQQRSKALAEAKKAYELYKSKLGGKKI